MARADGRRRAGTRSRAAEKELLGGLLRGVSRSFYLSLRILPRALRRPLGLAYLLARAADTLADRAWDSPAARLEALERFREGLGHGRAPELPAALVRAAIIDSRERLLLGRIDEGFALLARLEPEDRRSVEGIVSTLTEGMAMDLRAFEGGTARAPAALASRADLDRYTYLIAGAVGEFWSEVAARHRRSLARWDRERAAARGIRYGKGLQLTNILRDISHDLARGRVYLPREDLARRGLEPADLRDRRAWPALRPLIAEIVTVALDHLEEARAYLASIPGREIRLRLASAWPLLIALETLPRLLESDAILDPARRVRIPRGRVRRILAGSALRIRWNRTIEPMARSRMARARRAARECAY